MYLILRKERKESGTRKTGKSERKQREGVEEAQRERERVHALHTKSDLLCSARQNVKLVIKKEHRLPVGLKLASLLPKVC